MGERNSLNYGRISPEVFIFEDSRVMKAGLLTLNKTQCHRFHEVKRKRNRRVKTTLPATVGRSGLTLDCHGATPGS